MKRYIFPLLLGIVGCAILISLGVWQLQRLQWKEAMLAEISAKIGGAPQELPPEGTDTKPLKYQPVTVSGRTTGQEILVLSGQKGIGAGYRVIDAFETDAGRRILLDRGFLREADKGVSRPAVDLTITGNLHWPEETDSYTPKPDEKTGLWFARDVPAMAARLGTEPVMVVAARVEGDTQGIAPQPITITGIPNDHKQYAITWFLLAIVWAGMTIFLLWRIRRQSA
ncbi:cytochrome oxidase biogenesis protein Surf1, facilitates heme A insertion [Thioclava marina]|uniref:SURF1-like protein n=1 Tax=Thioclava marina TaxID=1915077 RepID=A0ABX3MKQ3_9RHOB|nr:SURF1 family protein [Thioclava marina]OOY12141.1 cytochrome oxidase biogenesis protein Surf1, facilitates heme A insertion [Thioclava marina]